MVKYYYEDILSNQNVTAKPNITWVVGIPTLELLGARKAYVFLCLDIHTNFVVSNSLELE